MLLARFSPRRHSRSPARGSALPIARPCHRRRPSCPPHVEPLEARQLLSGFGPADGAYVVAPWIGSYKDVQVQPGDQKIVAAGYERISTNPEVHRLPHGHRPLRLARQPGQHLRQRRSLDPAVQRCLCPGRVVYRDRLGLVLQPTDGKAVVSGALSQINRRSFQHQRHARQQLRQRWVDQSRRSCGGFPSPALGSACNPPARSSRPELVP